MLSPIPGPSPKLAKRLLSELPGLARKLADLMRHNWKLKLAALGLAVLLWIVALSGRPGG